jgi:hypothetical protein
MSDVTVDGATAGAGLSQVERVVDTFVAPTKTFTDILRSTSWWLPFLLAVLAAVGMAFTIDRQVGFERVVENQLQLNPKQEDAMSSLTPEQRATRMKGMVIGYKYSTYAFPVFVLIVAAIGATVLWASFNFGLGAETTFAQMFCLWLYCGLPRLIGVLLAIVTLCFGGNAESFDLKSPVGTNLGYYLTDSPQWLRAALGFFDILSLWSLVLLVIGTAVVAKVSRGKAAAVVVGWWALIFIASVAVTAATS